MRISESRVLVNTLQIIIISFFDFETKFDLNASGCEHDGSKRYAP